MTPPNESSTSTGIIPDLGLLVQCFFWPEGPKVNSRALFGSGLVAYCTAVFAWVRGAEVAAGIRLSPDSLVAAKRADPGAYFVAHIGQGLFDVVGDVALKADASAGDQFLSCGRGAFIMLHARLVAGLLG